MNACLADRLDIAHSAVARAGTSQPTRWLDEQILNPTPAEAAPAKPPSVAERKARRTKVSKEQAEKMAADLAGYDGQIKGGRLTGGG